MTPKLKYTRRGESLAPDEVAELRAIVVEIGLDAVAHEVGIAATTAARCAAGLSVYPPTAQSVRTYLARRRAAK